MTAALIPVFRNCSHTYVGDSGVDMQTAANAGVTACGVTWGFRPRTELEEFNPSYIADTAGEIKKLIL